MCFRIELSCEQYGYGGDRTVSEEINGPEFLTRQREALWGFRQGEARRETAESGAVSQRKDGLQAAEEEFARIKNQADGKMDAAQTAFSAARGELRKTGRVSLLDQTVEPQRKDDSEPTAELDQCTRAALQVSEALTQELKGLARWRAAQTRRRQALTFAGIAVALLVIVLVAYAVYAGYRQLTLYLHYRLAEAAIEAEDWEQAASLVKRLHALDPDYRDVPQLIAAHPQLTMVHLPAGEFKIGSDDGDSDERPAHTVALWTVSGWTGRR